MRGKTFAQLQKEGVAYVEPKELISPLVKLHIFYAIISWLFVLVFAPIYGIFYSISAGLFVSNFFFINKNFIVLPRNLVQNMGMFDSKQTKLIVQEENKRRYQSIPVEIMLGFIYSIIFAIVGIIYNFIT